jgi:uncharacterized repeat protein (TIGR03803 family)
MLVLLTSFLFLLNSAIGQTDAEADPNPVVGFKTLYNFTGGTDGCCIESGLARDSAGNLYGASSAHKDVEGHGSLFKLIPSTHGYKIQVLQDSAGTWHSSTPTLDSAGNLFGISSNSGTGAGILWEYSSQGQFSVLHIFVPSTDGSDPAGSVVLDNAGNIYGTAYTYGPGNDGTLWEYSPASGVFSVLHAFAGSSDGDLLPAGPQIDSSGKLWGTTQYGPNCYNCGNGTVWNYDLASGTFTTVLDFASYAVDRPTSNLTLDSAGNLYGTASGLEPNSCGLVYELQKNNNYALVILYSFTGTNGDGCLAFGSVTLDAQGNIFGATAEGGTAHDGTVFELTPVSGTWHETILHYFRKKDGWLPNGGLIADGAGHWFGTTGLGGTSEQGTVFEISGIQ